MKEPELNPQIEYLQQRVTELQQRAAEGSGRCDELLPEIVEELLTTLEELQVAEEELRQQNEELAAANEAVEVERRRYLEPFDLAPDGYIMTDAKGVIREANRAAAALLNVSQQFLLGKPFLLYLAEGERKNWHPQLAQLTQNDRVENWEAVLQPREGDLFYASITVMRMRDADGKATGHRFLIRDITARKKTEEELGKYRYRLEKLVNERTGKLRASNELLERIFSNTHVLIAYMDTEFNFIQVNRAYAEADEHVPDFFVGKNHFDLYPHKENEAIFRRVVGTGEPHSVYAKPFEYAEHPERGVTHWDWSLIPIKDVSGKVEGVLLCLVEVTERIRAEEELRRHRDHLEEMVQERTAALKATNEQLQEEIAERKKMEERLKFKASALYQINDAVIAIDTEERITYWNRAAEELYGLKAEEVLGKRLTEAYEYRWPAAEDKDAAEVSLAEKGRWRGENIHIKKNGERIFVETEVSILKSEKGADVGLLTVIRDITERKQTENAVRDALEESRQHAAEASALLESSRAVLEHQNFKKAAQAIFDSCRNQIGATAGYVALLSRDGTQNDVVFLESGGLPCSVDPDLPMPIRGLRAEAYRSGKPVYDNDFADSEWTEFLPAGHVRLDNVMFAPLILSGNAVGLMGLANKPGGFTDDDARLASAFADHASIALRNSLYLEVVRRSEAKYRDLSESLEEAVEEKVAELQQAQRLAAIGQMVSVVAHEIRNPLQNIRMGIDAVRKGMGGDKGKSEILEEVDYGINLLNRIVEELLEYSRPVKLQLSMWPVRDIVEQALHSLSHRLHNTNVHLELEKKDGEIFVDATKMTRTLVNLISNATEAMPDGGDLWICSKFSESDGANLLKLSISDSGCGIDAKGLERINEPFFTTKTSGTGLGIHICKKIVEAHKGSFSIKSTVNEGTTVEITLPVGNS